MLLQPLDQYVDGSLLLLCSIIWYLSGRDPNENLSKNDRVLDEKFIQNWVLLGMHNFGKYQFAFISFWDYYLTYISPRTDLSASSLDNGNLPIMSSQPLRLLGFLFFIFGGGLRIYAMRTLGAFFTFKLSIRSNHHIVKAGPYAWVRHPSYTGMLPLIFGAFVLLWTGGIGQRIIGPALSPQSVIILSIIPTFAAQFLILVPRIHREETMLEGVFENEWKNYTNEVPFRLIPLIW